MSIAVSRELITIILHQPAIDILLAEPVFVADGVGAPVPVEVPVLPELRLELPGVLASVSLVSSKF